MSSVIFLYLHFSDVFRGYIKVALDINGLIVAKNHQKSKMELFGKIVNGLKSVNYFYKNHHYRCLTGSSYASAEKIFYP